jgi:hypothetical protein
MCLVKSPPRLPKKLPVVKQQAVKVEQKIQQKQQQQQQQTSSNNSSKSEPPSFPVGLKILVVRGVDFPKQSKSPENIVEWDGITKDLRSFGFLVDFAPDLSHPLDGHDILLVEYDACFTSEQQRQALKKVSKAIPTLCFLAHSGGADALTAKIKEAKLATSVKEVVVCPCSKTKLELIWQHTVRRLMAEQGLTPGAIHGKIGEDFILGAKNYQARRCTSPIIKNIKREKRNRNSNKGKASLGGVGVSKPYSMAAGPQTQQQLANNHPPVVGKWEKKVKRRRRRSWKTHTLEQCQETNGNSKGSISTQYPLTTTVSIAGAAATASDSSNSSKAVHMACHLPGSSKEEKVTSLPAEVFGSLHCTSNPCSEFPSSWDDESKEWTHGFLDLLKVEFDSKTCSSDDSSFFSLPSPDVVSQLYL